MALNPHRYRPVLAEQESRHSTAGCLLSLLFFLPLFARYCNPALLFAGGLVYTVLVVPAAMRYISFWSLLFLLLAWLKAAVRIVRMGPGHLIYSINTIRRKLYNFLWYFWVGLTRLQHIYLHLDALMIMTNQVLFFMLAEKVLCPQQRLFCLYVLLFYTILAYLKKALQKSAWWLLFSHSQHRPWAQMFHETNVTDFLQLTSMYVAARLGKGVAMSMVLVIFTLQFNHLDSSFPFVLVTVTYFAITQCKFTGEERICKFIQAMKLDALEQLETLWVPFLFRGSTIVASFMFMSPLLTRHWMMVLVAAYTNLYVPCLMVYQKNWVPLVAERECLKRFRVPTREQLRDRGTQCAICLEEMTFARMTPCTHIFHGACLRRCLQESNLCPLCKQEL